MILIALYLSVHVSVRLITKQGNLLARMSPERRCIADAAQGPASSADRSCKDLLFRSTQTLTQRTRRQTPRMIGALSVKTCSERPYLKLVQQRLWTPPDRKVREGLPLRLPRNFSSTGIVGCVVLRG